MEGREPCPYRIVDDVGGAFCMGAIGGGVWNYFKGLRNAPKGERLRGGIYAVKARSPVVGGAFAVWGLCFASFDCSIAYVRKKEDPWNAILSGAATGGLLAIRAGPKAAAKNALIGGVILAMIEGASIALTKYFAPPASTMDDLGPANDPTAPPTGPGLLPSMGGIGGYFGGAPEPQHSGDFPEDVVSATNAAPFDPYSTSTPGFSSDPSAGLLPSPPPPPEAPAGRGGGGWLRGIFGGGK